MLGKPRERGPVVSRIECSCGAVGDILAPDAGYENDVRVALIEWTGGRMGQGRVAVEPLPVPVSACPRCEHRAFVYVNRLSTAVRTAGGVE